MALLLFSLAITVIATLIQAFWKMQTLKQRLIFTAVILLGSTLTYFASKDDAIKSDKLQADVEKSQLLLQSADEKITAQSKTINTGFSDLKSQMARQGINNHTIINTINNLQVNVQRLTVDSKNSISEALGSNGKQGLPGRNTDIYIPLGNKNAFILDTQNQFAVSSDAPNEVDKVAITINGFKRGLAPGEQLPFTDDQKRRVYLVYKGLYDKKMVFFVKGDY